MRLRVASVDDIPVLHRIRMAVAENRLADPARVTPADYVEHLALLGRGWIAERNGDALGFAIGRATDGNVWALFVDPAHANRGVGGALHDTMVDWLFAQGLPRLWLTTGSDTRAERFYRRRRWRPEGSSAADEIRLALDPIAHRLETPSPSTTRNPP